MGNKKRQTLAGIMLKCQVDIWKSLARVEKFIEWLDDKVFLGKVTFCGTFHFLMIPCVSSLLVKSPEKITPSFYFSGLLCFSENRC